MSYLIKLVRDRMGDTRRPGSSMVVYRPVDGLDRPQLLRRKLLEEALEYAIEPSVDELGDVYDVLAALCHFCHGITVGELVERTRPKYEERGGFEHGIGMFNVWRCPVDGGACYEQPRGADCCEACPAYQAPS